MRDHGTVVPDKHTFLEATSVDNVTPTNHGSESGHVTSICAFTYRNYIQYTIPAIEHSIKP